MPVADRTLETRTYYGPTMPPQTKRELDAASDILRALSAPVRIAMALQLRHTGRCVHELVGILNVSQPRTSQHLRVLKAAGVVHGTRNGREILYQLSDDRLVHLVLNAVAPVQNGFLSV